ncbi:MAG: molybdopterin-binding protein, partial [Paracoccaceae bacterium]
MSRIDDTKEFVPVRIAVLTVSDSRSLTEDKSGQTLVDRIEGAGHIVAQREIIRDERVEIAEQLRKWVAMDAIDVIISTGGT